MLTFVVAIIFLILLAALIYIAYGFKGSYAGMAMSLAFAISFVVLVFFILAISLVCMYGKEEGIPVKACMCSLAMAILFTLIITVYIAYTGTCIQNPVEEEEDC